MPLFGKKNNANSENRRRRRAQLLLNNRNLLHWVEAALYETRPEWQKVGRERALQSIKRSPNWKNLVPTFNSTLWQKLHEAHKSIRPQLQKEKNNKAANWRAQKQARQANNKRKANQHAAFLLTNEGKQWQRKNAEARRLKNEEERRAIQRNRNMWAKTGYTMSNFTYRN